MTPQGMSYVSGASAHPLLGLTIGAQLDRTAARFPDNEALVVAHQDVRWRYGTLTEKVDAFAAGLLALGLEPGDRIGIWSPNNSEWAVTQFAALPTELPGLRPARGPVYRPQGGGCLRAGRGREQGQTARYCAAAKAA